MEVQNRVYRREINVLDNEIGKLERALSSDPSIASSSHSSVVSRKVGMSEWDIPRVDETRLLQRSLRVIKKCSFRGYSLRFSVQSFNKLILKFDFRNNIIQ